MSTQERDLRRVLEDVRKLGEVNPNAAILELEKYRNSADFFPWGAHTEVHLLFRVGRQIDAQDLAWAIGERYPSFHVSWWHQLILARGTDQFGPFCKRIIAEFRKLDLSDKHNLEPAFLESLLTERPDDSESLILRARSEGMLDQAHANNAIKISNFLLSLDALIKVRGSERQPERWTYGVLGNSATCSFIDNLAMVNLSVLGVEELDGWDRGLAERLAVAVSAIMGWAPYFNDEGISSWATVSFRDRFAAVFWRLAMNPLLWLNLAPRPSKQEEPSPPGPNGSVIPFRCSSAGMEGGRGKLFVRPGAVELWALWNALSDPNEAQTAAESVARAGVDAINNSLPFTALDEWPRTRASANITRLNTNAGWYARPGVAAESFLDWSSRYKEALCKGNLVWAATVDLLPVAAFLPELRTQGIGSWTEEGFRHLLDGASVVFVTAFANEIRDHYHAGKLNALWSEVHFDAKIRSLHTIEAPMSVWPYYPAESWTASFTLLLDESARAIEADQADLFIVSSGAYGLPLALEISRRYRISCLSMGHLTNVYFGILTNDGALSSFYSRKPNSGNWSKVELARRYPEVARIDAGRYVGDNILAPRSLDERKI